MTVLVLNCGSSSIKFSLIDPRSETAAIRGAIQRIGSGETELRWQRDNMVHNESLGPIDYRKALDSAMKLLEDGDGIGSTIGAVGHRFVHGGSHFDASVVVDSRVLETLRTCLDLAPLHNPANLMGIEVAMEAFPGVPHAAVFDTAFHQTMPLHASLYPVPWEWTAEHGVRRYGFHGTSHQFVSREAIRRLGLDGSDSALVTAHLGNGCSTCAVKNGKSIDTSMGMTPLEGLMMGTRSGSVDPGLHAHMSRAIGLNVDQVTDQLNRNSGLLGVSGVDSDLRKVLEAASAGHERALLAMDMFCYRLAKDIGGLAVALGRLDALVFTGGIGENATEVRARVLETLRPLGFHLDRDRNGNHGRQTNQVITREDSTVAMVIATNEDLLIAQDSWELTQGHRGDR